MIYRPRLAVNVAAIVVVDFHRNCSLLYRGVYSSSLVSNHRHWIENTGKRPSRGWTPPLTCAQK